MDFRELIIVRESEFGHGVFASRDIKMGTNLLQVTGKEINFRQTTFLKEESFALQVDFDRYIVMETPIAFCNHSCRPNCFVSCNLVLTALENIKAGEELFWDYSTSMLERHWTMKCNCGFEECRKMVTDFDLLPSSIQLHYLQMEIVFPYIVKFLANRTKNRHRKSDRMMRMKFYKKN